MAEKKEKKEGSIKFADIQTMYERGMMGISSRTLDIAHAYKVVQFKTKLKNAHDEFEKLRLQAVKDAGIEDGDAFSIKFNALANKKRTEEEEKEFKPLAELNDRFNKMLGDILNDTCVIEPKTMPYEEWRKLQEENKEIKLGQFELLAQCESMLEGILWAAPAE